MFKFEQNLAGYCKKRGFDGVICGHIHHAEIKDIDGVKYMNDGDWVESCTALVEHHNGTWEIITWTKEKDNVVIDPISSSQQ
jgi:UDP-2,3-diacylglucosamine pyrophosphatase LpxH